MAKTNVTVQGPSQANDNEFSRFDIPKSIQQLEQLFDHTFCPYRTVNMNKAHTLITMVSVGFVKKLFLIMTFRS